MRTRLGGALGVVATSVVALLAASCGRDDGDDDDRPFCGDGTCGRGETAATCASDCAASAGPVCGDRLCNGNETAATCSLDCGPPPCSVADPSSCAGETLCVAGGCVAAFGRAYTIVVQSAFIPQFKPDGNTWDAFGGAPDAFAVIFLNAQSLGATHAIADNFTPVWNVATPPTPIAAGSTLRVDVYDQDVSANDGILSCSVAPLTADILHGGEVACMGSAGELRMRITTN
jgi:hypothetical protein